MASLMANSNKGLKRSFKCQLKGYYNESPDERIYYTEMILLCTLFTGSRKQDHIVLENQNSMSEVDLSGWAMISVGV